MSLSIVIFLATVPFFKDTVGLKSMKSLILYFFHSSINENLGVYFDDPDAISFAIFTSDYSLLG